MKKISVIVSVVIVTVAAAISLLGLLARREEMDLSTFEKGMAGITNAIGRAPSPFSW